MRERQAMLEAAIHGWRAGTLTAAERDERIMDVLETGVSEADLRALPLDVAAEFRALLSEALGPERHRGQRVAEIRPVAGRTRLERLLPVVHRLLAA
jgi:hypothetical protein